MTPSRPRGPRSDERRELDQKPTRLAGLVHHRGAGCVRLDCLNALLGISLRLVTLAGSNDLAVRGLQVKTKLASVVFADLELRRKLGQVHKGRGRGLEGEGHKVEQRFEVGTVEHLHHIFEAG